jgi:hypothetical protein
MQNELEIIDGKLNQGTKNTENAEEKKASTSTKRLPLGWSQRFYRC